MSHKYLRSVDESAHLASRYDIKSTPTFLIYAKGSEPVEIIGSQPYQVFQTVIDQLLANLNPDFSSIVLPRDITTNVVNATYNTEATQTTRMSDLMNISENGGDSTSPDIILGENNLYVVWNDNSTGNDEVYFRKSSDQGTKFSSIINISNNTGASTRPQIVASGNNLYVVWRDNIHPGKVNFSQFCTDKLCDDILLRKSSDLGESFGKPVVLSTDKTASVQNMNPSIADNENNLYVAWQTEKFNSGVSVRRNYSF
jgi:hypothetical protein